MLKILHLFLSIFLKSNLKRLNVVHNDDQDLNMEILKKSTFSIHCCPPSNFDNYKKSKGQEFS